MRDWMKKAIAAACCGAVLSLPVSAAADSVEMKNHILTLPVFPETAVELSAGELEQRLGLGQGDLLALTFLTVPKQGQLLSGGVVVERGETLLRRELERLCYLSDENSDDWFAILPVCSQDICAVVNLEAVL